MLVQSPVTSPEPGCKLDSLMPVAPPVRWEHFCENSIACQTRPDTSAALREGGGTGMVCRGGWLL